MEDLAATAIKYYIDDDVFDSTVLLLMKRHSSERNDFNRGGSRPGKKPNKRRDFEEAHRRIVSHYFSPESLYTETDFRRRYRMPKRLFNRLMEEIPSNNAFFQQRPDCTGKMGASTLLKLIASVKMLADGISADSKDEYCQLGESTILNCMKQFCGTVVQLYEREFLRAPNADDIVRIEKLNAKRGFPGMLGSIDCMHWTWKNCPKSWAGQFTGKEGKSTVILEAVASCDLWIWHAFFGLPGSLNDLNVLDRSPLFSNILSGNAPPCKWSLPGVDRNDGYYLADGIYPDWSCFMKTFSQPDSPKQAHFAKEQESTRKVLSTQNSPNLFLTNAQDVERAFGVLQARWHIIAMPSRLWMLDDMKTIMKACIILHNMIVNDGIENCEQPDVLGQPALMTSRVVRPRIAPTISLVTNNMIRLRDKVVCQEIRSIIIDHLWSQKGSGVIIN